MIMFVTINLEKLVKSVSVAFFFLYIAIKAGLVLFHKENKKHNRNVLHLGNTIDIMLRKEKR